MRVAEAGITELQKAVDTLIIIPNQNLFRIANEKTTFADAFAMADQVLYSGVACITDLMVKEGLINLDFADVRAIMREMGKAMMGTGEASGDKRAMLAAEAAIANPLLDEVSMKGARGLLISITGGNDLTLYEVDEAAGRIRQEVDEDANIILGATFDESLDGIVRVSVVATGIDQPPDIQELTGGRVADHRGRQPAAGADRDAPDRGGAGRLSSLAADGFAAEHDPPDAPRTREPRGTTRGFRKLRRSPMPRSKRASSRASMCRRRRRSRITTPKPRRRICVRTIITSRTRSSRRPPEQPIIRRQRMPQIDDLPLPGQNQIRAHRGEAAGAGASRSQAPLAARAARLLRREPAGRAGSRALSTREACAAGAAAFRLAGPAQRPQAPGPVHAEYGGKRLRSRGAAAGARSRRSTRMDGRPPIRPRSAEEDQLEIPAFLRRQSS